MRKINEIFKPVTSLADFKTIITESPHQSVSNRYGFIPTTRPLQVLAQYGWHPVAVAEQRIRQPDKVGYQMHAIKLRNETNNRALQVGQTIPELMLVNSHCGNASFRLLLALFETLCSNGLIVQRDTVTEQRVRHAGYADEAVATAIAYMVPNVEGILTAVEHFRNINLKNEEQRAFAEAAIELRWDGETYSVSPEAITYARRRDQREPTLWNTYNVVQETMIRGGVYVRNNEKKRSAKARAITGIQENERLNKALWKLTEKMAELTETRLGSGIGARD
jgi:hypothetical protein